MPPNFETKKSVINAAAELLLDAVLAASHRSEVVAQRRSGRTEDLRFDGAADRGSGCSAQRWSCLVKTARESPLSAVVGLMFSAALELAITALPWSAFVSAAIDGLSTRRWSLRRRACSVEMADRSSGGAAALMVHKLGAFGFELRWFRPLVNVGLIILLGLVGA